MCENFAQVKVLFQVKPTGKDDTGEPKQIVAGFKSQSSYEYFQENNDSLVCYLYRTYELIRKTPAFEEDTSDILDRFEWELIANPYEGPEDVHFYVADDYMGRHIDCYFLKREKRKKRKYGNKGKKGKKGKKGNKEGTEEKDEKDEKDKKMQGLVLQRRDLKYIKRAIEKDNKSVAKKVESFRKVLEHAKQRFGK